MKKEQLHLIEKLSSAHGAPGYEGMVTQTLRDELSDFNSLVDSMGNGYFTEFNTDTWRSDIDKPLVSLDCHTDEVALMVRTINPNGSMDFVALGGWAPETLVAQQMLIRNNLGDYIPAIIGSTPPHFRKGDSSGAPSVDDMTLDVGASSAEEVFELFGIEVGAPVVPKSYFTYNPKSQIIGGKAFDNRLGCMIMAEVLTWTYQRDLPVDVVGVASTQEEVGLRGAAVSSRRVDPTLAIVLEGTPADDLFMPPHKSQATLHKGPQIRFRDTSMVAHDGFVQLAKRISKESGIPIQLAVRQNGGTNGGSIHTSNWGVPTLVVGVPARYIHAPRGFASVQDIEHTIALVQNILQSLTKDVVDLLVNPLG